MEGYCVKCKAKKEIKNGEMTEQQEADIFNSYTGL